MERSEAKAGGASARVDSLLSAWLEAREAGRDLPAAEVCRDCPELLPEVERRLAELRGVYAMMISAPDPSPAFVTPSSAGKADDSLPELVGGYRVVRLLGAGGMGRVLEAEDTRLGRRIAVKVMRPELARDERARQRFLREARAAATLQHDHVVPVYQVGEEEGLPFLVMPLLQGETLAARLERERMLPIPELMRVGQEVAEGLAAAHAAGLIHRDIKPANLWLEAPSAPLSPRGRGVGGEGRVKILDFGLARQQTGSDGLTQSGMAVGTPSYISPEQANGQPVDARTDLFSLGCVLYRAATGEAPFPDQSLPGWPLGAAEPTPPAPYEIRQDMPPGLSDLILRLLAKVPADRPATAAEVAAWLSGQAYQETTTWKFPSWPGRWRRALVAAGLLAVVAAGWWAWQRPGASKEDVPPVRYRGQIDVRIERPLAPGEPPTLVRLDDPRALPMRLKDLFRIDVTVEPEAYLYVVWVEPGRKVTLVYPWDAEKDGSPRPAREERTAKLTLPADLGESYQAEDAKPGVATMVVLARATPLGATDAEVRGWFSALPELPLPPGGERGAAWFEDYAAVTDDPRRPRSFKAVATGDPFARWQGMLKKAVGDRAGFQSAVSFARVGGK